MQFTRTNKYSYEDVYISGKLPTHGDLVGEEHVWDDIRKELVMLEKKLDTVGYVPPRVFDVCENGMFDPYHWMEICNYFWLDEKICSSLRFEEDENGHYIAFVNIRGREYVVIVDDALFFFHKKKKKHRSLHSEHVMREKFRLRTSTHRCTSTSMYEPKPMRKPMRRRTPMPYSLFIFTPYEIEFNGEIEYVKGYPTYRGVYCFFLTINI